MWLAVIIFVGLSVEVLMQTAGKDFPILVKKELSSGKVPESETTA